MLRPHRYLITAVTIITILAAVAPVSGTAAPAEALALVSTQSPTVDPTMVAIPAPAPVQMLALKDALAAAEKNSLALQTAALQVPKARIALDRWKAAGATGGQALALGLQMRYGVALPGDDITAAALRRSFENTLQQAALGLEVTRQSLHLAVNRAYVEWQKADAQVSAQAAALNRAQAQADLARKAEAAGTAAHYDVIQADAQVSAQTAALVAAQSGRDLARLSLARLIGVPIESGQRPEPPTAPPATSLDATNSGVDHSAEDAIAKALTQRPDVALGKLNVQSKEADLDLLGQYFQADDPVVAGARLAVQEAALNLASTQADIGLQIQQSLLSIGSAEQRLTALAAGTSQSREALRLAQLRFEAGTATTLEVVSAQAALSQAEAARIQAMADLAAAQAALQQATGDL